MKTKPLALICLTIFIAIVGWRQYIKLLDGDGIFHALSSENGRFILIAAIVITWLVVARAILTNKDEDS